MSTQLFQNLKNDLKKFTELDYNISFDLLRYSVVLSFAVSLIVQYISQFPFVLYPFKSDLLHYKLFLLCLFNITFYEILNIALTKHCSTLIMSLTQTPRIT